MQESGWIAEGNNLVRIHAGKRKEEFEFLFFFVRTGIQLFMEMQETSFPTILTLSVGCTLNGL